MWDSILPVTNDHGPIEAEGASIVNALIFNAGPDTIEAHVWSNWSADAAKSGIKDVPDFSLELRAGNQRIVTGMFFRVTIKATMTSLNPLDYRFAAVGVRIVKQ